MKSVRIRSYSCLNSPAFGLNEFQSECWKMQARIWSLLMCLLSSFNIKIPINSHTSARLYAPILTSKLLSPFMTHDSSLQYKRDFLAWNNGSLSFLVKEMWRLANLITSHKAASPLLMDKSPWYQTSRTCINVHQECYWTSL